MLTISKPAVFGDDSLPVRGQCQPHARDWRLRIVRGGEEELLMIDTYYTCRKVQKACAGLSDEDVREKVKEMTGTTQGVEETQIVQMGRPSPEETAATPAPPAGLPENAGDTAVIDSDDMKEHLELIRQRRQQQTAGGDTQAIPSDELNAQLSRLKQQREQATQKTGSDTQVISNEELNANLERLRKRRRGFELDD